MKPDNSWVISVSYGEVNYNSGIITQACLFMIQIDSSRELG